jgi:Ser/Thr protein kinase RdoA (MazF antagonist)
MDAIAELGPLFGIAGARTDLEVLGGGHIHDTFLATYAGGDRWIHQRLNESVFTDVELLMANFLRVTTHLDGPLRLRPAAGGRPYARDDAGAPWRTLAFIDGARAGARFDRPEEAAEGAALAAALVAGLADLDPPPAEVIPGFHDVVARLGHLEQARDADVCGRAASCAAEADAILDHAGVATSVADARAAGVLPERTVHNDAKVENLLFDASTGAGVCMVDLDTVGPGTVLFDVGDLVRSGAVRAAEDGDPAGLTVDHTLVAAVHDGYAGAGFLTRGEVDLLPLAGPLMALEAAARFLTDHLRGDVYFRITDPDHNLRRARNQLRALDLFMSG